MGDFSHYSRLRMVELTASSPPSPPSPPLPPLLSLSLLPPPSSPRFSRLKETGDQLQDRPLTQPWHILAAIGKIKPSLSDPQMLQHSWVGVSQCRCDVTLCGQNCGCLFMNGVKYLLLKLHGEIG